MSPFLDCRFARNGGQGRQGSIEESEIKNLSRGARGFGVISGRAFLHREQAEKHLVSHRSPGGTEFALETLYTKAWRNRERQANKDKDNGQTRIIHITIFGNSLVAAAWPPYVTYSWRREGGTKFLITLF